ncbi:hypothetical protein BQ8420_10800 [Nocardiopsis sp. JB363]|nr:hypothetical protein BQ8420_10800 [Nocardiopsis sp. JB363]
MPTGLRARPDQELPDLPGQHRELIGRKPLERFRILYRLEQCHCLVSPLVPRVRLRLPEASPVSGRPWLPAGIHTRVYGPSSMGSAGYPEVGDPTPPVGSTAVPLVRRHEGIHRHTGSGVKSPSRERGGFLLKVGHAVAFRFG